MKKGGRWYRSQKYNQPCEPEYLGDGSLVECVADPDERHPNALKVTRIWPDGLETVVRKTPPGPCSNALYLSIEGDRDPQEPAKVSIEAQLASPDYRPPHAITSAIPGNKPGDNIDPATRKYFSKRSEFTQYYEANNLEKVSAGDSTLDRNGYEKVTKDGGKFATFDPNKSIPVPPEFAGVKFHHGSS